MKTIKIFAIAACVLLFTSCGGSKKVAKTNSDEVEVTQLCHNLSDEENYFANSVAQSSDMQMAKDKAINSGRAELAATLSTAVENFTKRYRKDVNDQLDQKTEDRLQILVKQTLSGSTVVCDRITRTQDGLYRAYVSVKLSKKEVSAALERAILENQELKLNFDQAQFDKVADEAIKSAGK
ncbi:MAG: hypothetical protein PHR45_00780 [Muribaculaceae bacterium]|nr:hypothetical protein [Muribaculaceae bacterium]